MKQTKSKRSLIQVLKELTNTRITKILLRSKEMKLQKLETLKSSMVLEVSFGISDLHSESNKEDGWVRTLKIKMLNTLSKL